MDTPRPRHTHSLSPQAPAPRTSPASSSPPTASSASPVPPAAVRGAAVGSSQWLSGTIIEGHYQVGSLIGRGGMSEVYYALDLWSNNPVAVKVLSPELAKDATNRQKFHREERSMRQVSGGHTVGVISSGTVYVEDQMVMYIVLEYVHGCTLSQLLRVRRALSLGETLDILLPVVEALSEVHANRYVHGDIKPGNILLDANGQVKLTDFGLSRRDDQAESGSLMGTPAYVAPEVLDPTLKVRAQADIFALGVVMYRMLAGRLPFIGLENDQQVLYHNANVEMPALTDIAPGIDRDIAGLVSWCTRKQPQSRPEDATELFASLMEVSASLGERELAWRTANAPATDTTLWQAVADIAERSGASQMVRNTPISAFSDAGDLLAYDVYSPDSLLTTSSSGHQVHLADVDAEDSVLNAEGIPPLERSIPAPLEADDEDEDEESVPLSSQSQAADLDSQTEQESISASKEYSPIYAERPLDSYLRDSYSRYSADDMASQRNDQEFGRAPREPDASSLASSFGLKARTEGLSESERPRDRRLPAKKFGSTPSGTVVGVWALAVIMMGVSASFTGWWAATSVLQSAWWQGLSGLFGAG